MPPAEVQTMWLIVDRGNDQICPRWLPAAKTDAKIMAVPAPLDPQDVGVSIFPGQTRCKCRAREWSTCSLFAPVQDVWSPNGPQQGCLKNLISRLQLPETMFAPDPAHADRRDHPSVHGSTLHRGCSGCGDGESVT